MTVLSDGDELLFANPACTCGHTYIEHLRQPYPEPDGTTTHYSQGCHHHPNCDCDTFQPREDQEP